MRNGPVLFCYSLFIARVFSTKPALSQRGAPCKGTYRWDLPLGPTVGTYRWDLPLGPTAGTYHWDLTLGAAEETYR